MSFIVVIAIVGYHYLTDCDGPFGGAFGTYVRPLRSMRDAKFRTPILWVAMMLPAKMPLGQSYYGPPAPIGWFTP